MGIIEDVCKVFPALLDAAKRRWSGQLHKRLTDALPGQNENEQLVSSSILLEKRHAVNCVRMTRIYANSTSGGSGGSSGSTSAEVSNMSEMNHRVDAILAHVAHLDNIPTLQLIPNGHFMVSYKDKPFQITKDIFMKIDEIRYDEKTGNIVTISILLMSNVLSASDISQFVDNMYATYQEDLKNSLGKNIYFFDQKYKGSTPPRMPADTSAESIANHRRMLIQSAPKQLNFTMTPFYSNKRFGNIFGTDVRKVQNRVEFFLNNRDWYDRKGIPYQLGIMLSGLPGTGKTSIIRAIANLTKRHIINVNFANITTATQLKNLFYNERIEVYTDCNMSDTKSFFIPIDQRLYILEEIDAVSNILKQRSMDDTANTNATGDMNVVVADELTLGEILTVLDGTMEIPGRMIIMTSNHPEFLDRALLRPGRIDVNAKFGNATRELIAEMWEEYLEIPFPKDRISELPDGTLTPAEASEVIMRYCKSADLDDHLIDLVIRELSSHQKEEVVNAPQKEERIVLTNMETPKESVVATVSYSPQDDTEMQGLSPEPPKDLMEYAVESTQGSVVSDDVKTSANVDPTLLSSYPKTMNKILQVYEKWVKFNMQHTPPPSINKYIKPDLKEISTLMLKIKYNEGLDDKIYNSIKYLENLSQIKSGLKLFINPEDMFEGPSSYAFDNGTSSYSFLE